MLARTGFPEYLESIAIGPDPEFMRTQTDLCDIATEFPQEVNAMYLWKKIATSADPIVELRDFVKHFLLDGPDFSEEFILHFVKKVNMLPPDLKDQIMYEIDDAFTKKRQGVPPLTYDPVVNTFNEISNKIAADVSKRKFNKSRAVNDDPDFLDKLSGMMDSCKSSCNYFAPVTDKIGSIFDFSRMNSINASMPHDADLNAPPPTGLGLNIMNKIPRGIQNTLMEAYTSAKLLADAAKEQLTSPGTTKALREFAKQGISAERKGVPFIGSTGSSLFQDALGLNSSLLSKVKRKLGDCFRIADFLNRYNAFDEDMNLAIAQKKVFKLQIPDASLGGAKRTWSGTAQGVSSGQDPGSDPYNNNATPQFALKPQTTGDARNYDDAQKATPKCPEDTPVGQASDNATPPTPGQTGDKQADSMTGAKQENINNSAKNMIGTSTKEIPGTQNGNMGCAAATSMMFKNATGENILPGKSMVLGTDELYSGLSKDPRFEKLDLSQARPGDIVVTARNHSTGKAGHTGVVTDGGRIISNSSSGFKGSAPGTIQNNYSVDSWSKVAARNPSQTAIFRYKGK
jgi:hypothetical protein